MLSMKTLRVAIVTMGSALLLGSGVAVAQTTATTIRLDATAVPGQTADTPLSYVAERLGVGGSAIATGAAKGKYLLVNASAFDVRVTSAAALDANDYFARLSLGGGMVFGTALADSDCGEGSDSLVIGGGVNQSVAVCRLGTIARGTRGGSATEGAISFVVTSKLAVPSKEPASYSATISLHDDQFEAEEGIDVKASGHVGGTATIVRTTSGIAATVTAGTTAVAEVDTGFLWFVGPTAAASLGTVSAMEKNAPTGGEAPLDPDDGVAVESGTLIDDTDGLTINIMGNLGIGVWNLKRTKDGEGMYVDNEGGTPQATAHEGDSAPMCPPYVGSASSPVDIAEPGEASNLALDEDDPGGMASLTTAPGTFMLCVTVDTAGMESNTMPIPSGEYMAEVNALGSDADPRDAVKVAEGTVGAIRRNGASASVAYLTTSDKHNQRLIIVNRGSRPVMITDIMFQTEDGTEADLTDAAKAAAAAGLGAIGPGESMTTKVSDMVEITGNSRRAAAIMSFNGTAANISVATTQVNLSDSSTDTVMWPVVEG